MSENIECSFKQIPWYPHEGTKSGRYSGGFYWNVKDFGIKNWVILAYIDVNWPDLLQSKSKEEIEQGCLQFLNSVLEKKKSSKKEPQPIYGNLKKLKIDFVKKNEKPILICELITDQRKNEYFWCEGQTI